MSAGGQCDGFFVDQLSVLDAADAGGDGDTDGTGRIGVHGDVGAPVLGDLHRGPHLCFGVLGDVERIIVRCAPATGHQFQLRCAAAQHLARATEHLCFAVGDNGCTDDLAVAQVAGHAARCFVR